MKLKDYYVSWMYLKENGIKSISSNKNIKTRCIIKQNDEILETGECMCGKNDNFNKESGRKLSLSRALKSLYPNQKEKRTEFWNVYNNLGRFPRWKQDTALKELSKILEDIKSIKN